MYTAMPMNVKRKFLVNCFFSVIISFSLKRFGHVFEDASSIILSTGVAELRAVTK